jgi:hypothetical protein
MTTIASLATETTRGAFRGPAAGRAARSGPSASLAPRRPSRSSRAISARVRDRRGARLSAAAGGGDRVSVGDMKRALVNAGVDTSSCFERADLEAKFALLTDAQKANTGANAEGDSATSSARGASSSKDESTSRTRTTNSSQSSSGKDTNTSEETRRGANRDDDAKKEKAKSGGFDGASMFDAALNAVRETANRLEVRFGVGAKIKEQTKGLRQTIVNLDGQLGVSKFVKNTVPPLWAKLNAFRATPLGRVANFAFYLWLFLSGAFWTLLSFGLTAAFLVNLLFPQFFAQRAAKMQEQARERFAQQRGAWGACPGGMGGPGMGGFGGPPPGGMGGMGGPPPGYGGYGQASGRTGGRKSYGAGNDGGSVVDIDADVKDV